MARTGFHSKLAQLTHPRGKDDENPKKLFAQKTQVYRCELDLCTQCGQCLEQSDYLNGRKLVQTMSTVLQIGYYAKRCPRPECEDSQSSLRSAAWQQVAPLYGTYGFDGIGQIGWQRQRMHQTYEEIHRGLRDKLQISQAQVRYLYTYPIFVLLNRTQMNADRRRFTPRNLEKIGENQPNPRHLRSIY